MKSPIFLLTLWAGVGLAQGQGTVVNFNNNIPAGGDHKVYFGGPGCDAGVVGTNYWAELYYVDPTTSALTPWAPSISKFRVSTTASPGTWSGKTVTLPPGNGLPGITLQVEVRVWDANFGPRFGGSSGLFTYTWHDNSPLPAQPTDTQMVNMPPFAIFVGCPEPSIVALAVSGLAGLLLFRHRK